MRVKPISRAGARASHKATHLNSRIDPAASTPAVADARGHAGIASAIAHLARNASIEANVHDVHELHACHTLIRPGTRMYVSHLPRQRWAETIATSSAVRAAGFTPVPHIPIRLLESDDALHRLIDALSRDAHIKEVLLISGDYAQAQGPYSQVIDVLRTFPFSEYGINGISLAGHPEGHPQVAREIISEAERAKCNLVMQLGLQCRLVTQFFFEAEPFLTWSQDQIDHGMQVQRIAGIAGPASIATLFKLAMRCGVGQSLRALGVRPGAMLKLMGDYSPNDLVAALAQAQLQAPNLFDGLHVFCFGGLVKTCKWLHAVANGQFESTGST